MFDSSDDEDLNRRAPNRRGKTARALARRKPKAEARESLHGGCARLGSKGCATLLFCCEQLTLTALCLRPQGMFLLGLEGHAFMAKELFEAYPPAQKAATWLATNFTIVRQVAASMQKMELLLDPSPGLLRCSDLATLPLKPLDPVPDAALQQWLAQPATHQRDVADIDIPVNALRSVMGLANALELGFVKFTFSGQLTITRALEDGSKVDTVIPCPAAQDLAPWVANVRLFPVPRKVRSVAIRHVDNVLVVTMHVPHSSFLIKRMPLM